MRSAPHIILVSLVACGSPGAPAPTSRVVFEPKVEASPVREEPSAIAGQRLVFRESFPKDVLEGHRARLRAEMAKCLPRAKERSLQVEVGIRLEDAGAPAPVLVTGEVGDYRRTAE